MSNRQPVSLGQILSVQNGFAFDSKRFGDDGIPLIRIRDLKHGSDTQTRYLGDYDPQYLVDTGDLLIGMDGEFRCYEWKGGRALLNQRVCRLQDFAPEVEPKYIKYAIDFYLQAIEETTTYTTVKHLSSKQIKEIEIPLPPLDEQKRIVAKLDEVEDLKSALEKRRQIRDFSS